MGAAPSTMLSSTSSLQISTSSAFLSTSSLPVTTSAIPTSTSLSTSSILSTSTPVATPSGPYVPVPYQNPSTASASSVRTRKDIDTLSQVELDLVVLGYQQWQNASASLVAGYFQVAGIHGAPHQYWDDEGGFGDTTTGYKGTGYCFHGDQNFYLWHRPYVTLVEQEMVAAAVSIANNWYVPQRATYQAAAATLAHPYWDWAKGTGVPGTLANKQISVTNPATGQSMTINNPLYSHTLVSDGNLGTTSNGGSIAVGQNGGRTTYRGSKYLTNMQNAGASLKRNTALLFNTANVCWNVFATYNTDEQQQCDSNPNIQSLEGIHNTIHNTVAGTMANLDIAAFDPIFWLHHCNVDRLGAIWQAINPTTFVDSTYGSDQTFVVDAGDRDDTFQLLPFRASQGDTDWWQPNKLYNTFAVGYTYPELSDSPDAATALSRANAIYGTGRTQQALVKSASSKLRRNLQVRQAADNTILVEPPTTDQLAPYSSMLIAANGSFNEYSVGCSLKKSVAEGKSFDLHLFFGAVADDNYIGAANRVGGFSVSQAGGSSMTTEVNGVVPITDALLNELVLGGIKDMEPDTVQKYVDAKLIWRLVTVDGDDIGGDAINGGLVLNVKHTVVTPKADVNAQPIVAVPNSITNTTNTDAQPLPSGVAATSLSSAAATAL
ncbi:hypothetical protein AMS68_001773 [Peltaster fructicola]|uniref:tyrosinase n=1 Tax=Peltaster fructicola TaxID=286661 RepID=A0A6H0XNI2_9PEZI|nr:hypothetical protein AMS68_001773 [Peltaster fructicola]